MRTAFRVVAVIAALPGLWIVGFFVANPLSEPRFAPVDLADPPIDLALLGAWDRDDGDFACRAFYYRDLAAGPVTLPALRHALTPAEFESCQVNFGEYGRPGGWADAFDFDRRGFAARVGRADDDPHLFTVTYMSDDDRFSETRYRVDSLSGEPIDYEHRGSFGPARGLTLLLFGWGGGTVAWLVLVGFLIGRHIRNRRIASRTSEALDAAG